MAAPDPFAECKPKYEVHSECYDHVASAVSLGVKPYSQLTITEAREQVDVVGCHLAGKVDFAGEDREIFISSAGVSEGIPVTIYKPKTLVVTPAIVVYFHGGGLVCGSRKSHQAVVKTLASATGAIFLNVEYRLLPDPGAPLAPFEDGLAVTRWVMNNKEKVGGNQASKVGVAGDSAGGHISACVTNDLPGVLDFQVLIYPNTDTTHKQPSFSEFTVTPGLTKDAYDWYFGHSIAHIPDAHTNPGVNPMVRTNTSTSPPALVLMAELDALRDCGLEYVDKLRAAGVPVESYVIKGVPHAFFGLCDTYKTKTAEAYGHIITFIQKYQQ